MLRDLKLSIGLSIPPPRNVEKAAARQITVAVMDFENRSTSPLPSLGLAAQDITIAYLQTLPGVVLVARDWQDSALKGVNLPDTLQTNEDILRIGNLLHTDMLVTGSIVRYEVERRTFSGYGISPLRDVFHMSVVLKILDAKTPRVKYAKNFDVELTKEYLKATSAPEKPIDLTNKLLEDLLTQARSDLRSALAQLAGGLESAGQLIDVLVNSRPAGAEVTVDGIHIGKTPITLQLALDVHEINIELIGYEPCRRRFKAKPGAGIEAILVPKPKKSLEE
jgi:hypothetical protein